jgi:hypothetical protein
MAKKKTSDFRICGYCYTGHHHLCRPEIRWYEQIWYCYCETCKVNTPPVAEEEETPNEEIQ